MNAVEAKDKAEWARKKGERLLLSARASRVFWDSIDALSLCYASGRQWAHVTSSGSGRALKRLKEIIDPEKEDIRVTLDRTSRLVRRTVAGLKPRKFAAHVMPIPHMAEALNAKQVYDEVLSKTIRETHGLGVYRLTQLPRVVLGTAYIRRTIRKRGRTMTLPAEMQPERGQKLELRDLRCGWELTMPWEVIRDPAARALDIEDWESIVGIEKPWSLREVRREFPNAREYDESGTSSDISSKTTFGELMAFESEIARVSGRPMGRHAADSKEPALIVYEFLLRDDEEPEDWSWQYIAGYDPHHRGDNEGKGFLKTLHFGRNPHWGSSLHAYHYESQVNTPRARSLPLCVKQLQDITNVSWSQVARVLWDAAHGRWLIQEGTVEKPEEALIDRLDSPLIYKAPQTPGAPFHKPERAKPGEASPVATQMVAALGDEMKDAANLAPIQFGEMVRRGQSGEAYERVAEQAESVMDDLRQDDELETGKLFMGTLMDTCRLLRMRPDKAIAMLHRAFPIEQIASALDADPRQFIESVGMRPDPLRNRSPGQIKDEFTQALGNQLLEPENARWEIMVQADIAMDSGIAIARRKQLFEIQQILAGERPEANAYEDHQTAMRVLREEVFSANLWYRLDEKRKKLFEEHFTQHMTYMLDFARWGEVAMQGPGAQAPAMGSPPAGQEMPLAGVGAVGPGVNVG